MKDYNEKPLGAPYRRVKIIKYTPKEYLTANQYLENNWGSLPYNYEDIIQAMVEFAHHHVTMAKQELNEKSKILSASRLINDNLLEYYPTKNIK